MSEQTDLSLLNELADSEDEFNVDLMAAGCRRAVEPTLELSVSDLVRLHNLDTQGLMNMIDGLIEEGGFESKTVFRLAQNAASA